MRTAGLSCPLHCGRTRISSRRGPESVCFWLVLIACLAQLWGLPPDGHMRGAAARALTLPSDAANSALVTFGFGARQADIRCSWPGLSSGSQNGNAPASGRHDTCPCCPLGHAIVGILPPEGISFAYIPLLSKTVTPPPHFGAFARSSFFAGQPRAPPARI